MLIAGSVELGTVDIPASRVTSLELPENVVRRLEAGWAIILPICEPCFPSDPRCAGYQFRIERLDRRGLTRPVLKLSKAA